VGKLLSLLLTLDDNKKERKPKKLAAQKLLLRVELRKFKEIQRAKIKLQLKSSPYYSSF